MALLSVATRKKWFEYCGLGKYNKANILKMQKKYMLRKSDWDGQYGPDTDALLRHLHHVKLYTKNFSPEEFRCGCGGRYCSGYPTWMRANELKHIQTIRSHYGKPMNITSALRCEKYNSRINGASANSRHLKGKAVDFYMSGVSDTLAHRKKAIKYIKKLKNHHYTYGNGYNSNGYAISAPGMADCLHTDVK